MSDSQKSQPLVDLSELRLMPKWVAEFGKASPSVTPDSEEQQRPRRHGRDRDRRFSGPRGESRGPRSDANSTPGARDRRGPQDNRSRGDNRPPRARGPENRGGKRDGRDRDRGDRPRHRDYDRRPVDVQIQLPEGLTAEIEPEARAVEAMSAMIRNAGKAYSVFDAARLVLSSGDRYHVKFSLPKESDVKLYAIPADGSLWLSRPEAIEHFLNSDGIKEFYRVEEVQLEAPKGVFTNVAICGLSGELLGPTSHHSYQTNLHRVHRERFSHLPFEEYKRRVRIDNNPELIEKWKESQTRGTHWIPINPDETAPSEPVPATAETVSETAETPEVKETEVAAEAAEVAADIEVTAETAEAPATETGETEAVEAEAANATESAEESASNEIRLKSRAEMREHFRTHFVPTLIHETSVRYVAGNIPKNHLHPALYQLLRRTVDETRKHLLGLAQRLCSGFEHNGLKLFKRRGGKLWVSRIRPRLLDNSVVLSERIARMMEIVKAQPGISAKDLIEAVAPSPSTSESTTAPVEGSAEAAVETQATVAIDAVEAVPTEAAPLSSELPALGAQSTSSEAVHEPTPAQVEALKDLLWLNSEGYVIEYADGLVFPGVTEPPPAKPKAPKVKATSSETTEGAAEAEAAAEVTAEAETETSQTEASAETAEAVVTEEAAETASESTATETAATTEPVSSDASNEAESAGPDSASDSAASPTSES